MTTDASVSEQEALRPTKERMRHDAVTIPEKDREHQVARPARIETQTMLDRYSRRKTLDENQLAAGTKYAAHFILSKRHGMKLMTFEGRVSGGRSDASDIAIAAGLARDKAMTCLESLSVEYKSVVERVCADDLSAEAWAVERKLHPMKGIGTLRKALDALAKHYGIVR